MIDATLPGLDVQAVWDGACRILERTGMMVANEKALRAAAGELAVSGDRVRFGRDVLEHYADEIRRKAGPPPAPPTDDPKSPVIFNSSFCHHYLDPRTGQTRPYDTAALIRHMRLVGRLADEGVMVARIGGYPLDVPAPMQFLTAYYVDCCHNRHPSCYPLVSDEPMLRYAREISEVMGLSQGLGAEPISPLKFAGASIDLAVEHCRDKGLAIGLDAMPILGVTAPLDWHAAWAQSVAENLGSYVLLRLCGCEKLSPPSFRLFLPNFMTGTTYFSSPQHIFALLSRRKVREFFHLGTGGGELLLITSKAPDAQAAAEKMAGCVLGKLLGFGFLEGAGNLWMDEVFSPQQLLVDIDIAGYARAIAADFGAPAGDLAQMVEEGVRAGSFLQSDLTLEKYADFLWRPAAFDLGTRAGWDGRSILDKGIGWSERKIAEYDYELAGDRREQLDRIMARARKELAN